MGDEFDGLFATVKERIRDNANLSLKAEIQTVANKEEILVITSGIKCAKSELELHQGRLESLSEQLKLQEALRESLEQRVEKLEALAQKLEAMAQQKEEKIQELTGWMEAVY